MSGYLSRLARRGAGAVSTPRAPRLPSLAFPLAPATQHRPRSQHATDGHDRGAIPSPSTSPAAVVRERPTLSSDTSLDGNTGPAPTPTPVPIPRSVERAARSAAAPASPPSLAPGHPEHVVIERPDGAHSRVAAVTALPSPPPTTSRPPTGAVTGSTSPSAPAPTSRREGSSGPPARPQPGPVPARPAAASATDHPLGLTIGNGPRALAGRRRAAEPAPQRRTPGTTDDAAPRPSPQDRGGPATENVSTVHAPTPTPARSQPASRSRATQLDGMPATRNTVQVHIGTIEIQGLPVQDTPRPGPVPAPQPAPPPTGAFDDFVDLRTYAPWRW